MAPIEKLSQRLRAPNDCRELALLTSRQHTLVHRALELRPETLMKLFAETDAFRRPERFAELLLACECDARGRAGLESRPYPQADYLRQAHAAAAAAGLDPTERQGLTVRRSARPCSSDGWRRSRRFASASLQRVAQILVC